MAKKKSTKQSASKRTPAKKTTSAVELIQVPAHLAAKLDKDIISLQKADSKLEAAIAKTSTQVKKADAKVKSLTRAAAAKKQINKAKKVLASLTASLSSLNKQHETTAKTLESQLQQKAKLAALEKCLVIFEKEWAKSAKLKKAKVKVKAQKRKKAVKPVSKLDIIESSSIDQADANDIEANEPTEIAA